MHHGGRHAVAARLGLHCKRPAPGMAAGATAEGLAAQLLQFMTEHPPEELQPGKSNSSSSSGETRDGSTGSSSSSSSSSCGDAVSSPTDLRTSSSGSLDSTSSRGTSGAEKGSSSSSSSRSSIGRGRLARPTLKVRLKRHSWRQLPTQRQLLAAGRPDLVAGLQKYGHDRIRRMLGLPQPERKQLRKVGDCVVWRRISCLWCRVHLLLSW
jgi:hypothetical protein